MIRSLAALLLLGVAALPAQSVRVATWGSYEGVTGSDDWSTLGAQLTWRSRRGDALWLAAEAVRRFGTSDGGQRVGGVLHPHPRWWLTLEAGTAAGPELVPKNSWDVDATALVSRRTALGMGYRRQNYLVGPVDIVMPHAGLQLGKTALEGRAYVSRNPSDRTDVAVLFRATTSTSRRSAASLGVAAGRESYLVGAPPAQQVQSLETVAGTAGVRYNAGRGYTVRADVSVVRSRPALSRRGVAFGVERQF